MDDRPPEPNGTPRWRPGLPTGLFIGAIIVALLAVTGLIYLLYNRTQGPAEILRDFARAADRGDCEAAYDLLDERVREGLDQETFCTLRFSSIDEGLDAGFTLDRVVYHQSTQTADVTLTNAGIETWRLKRHGNSWRVVLPEVGVP